MKFGFPLVKDEQGNPSKFWDIVRDITERKAAENNLERVRYSVDNISDTVLWVDENGKFIDANEGACKNLGYEYEETYDNGCGRY